MLDALRAARDPRCMKLSRLGHDELQHRVVLNEQLI